MTGKRTLEDSRQSAWKRVRHDQRTPYHSQKPSKPYQRQSTNWRPSNTPQIPSSLLAAKVTPSTPNLSDLKRTLQTQSYPWDRAPPGYADLNVRALKLFGLATPQTDFRTQQLPSDFDRFRHVRKLDTASSSIFRTINGKIYDSLESAALVVAELPPEMEVDRPPIALELLKQLAPSKDILLHKNTVIHPADVKCAFEVESELKISEKFTASLLPFRPASLPPNHRFLYPIQPEDKYKQTVEVLNVFPMRKSLDAVEQILLDKLQVLCQQIGFAPLRVKTVTEPPYELPRVFIELLDPTQCRDLAVKLGEKKLHGRSLITQVAHIHNQEYSR